MSGLSLALDAPGAVSLHQGVHFFGANHAIVPRDGVFEAAGGYGKFQRCSMVGKLLQSVNQTAGETVAAADAVHMSVISWQRLVRNSRPLCRQADHPLCEALFDSRSVAAIASSFGIL